MATAIEFNHIGKQYRLGLVSTGTISHDLNRWWQTAVLRREDPYLKIGSVNDRTQKADSDYVWALRDIDFKVEQGDVVGIIGKNGAGKSTLLKLLSKVTAPTVGTIRARGRIASLLEVGTGFHPEMTGRENIYMNGAILGMTKAEITRKLDEIVDFSGCERYLDTPVKRYSSGMMVRLGFAVAAHLDPEILVVDEVLAVGDAEFQKKAIGKMQDVSKGEGRTVLFVSHNMASIRSLCKSGVVLDRGQLVYEGTTLDAISYYKRNSYMENVGHKIIDYARYQLSSIELKKVTINGGEDSCVSLDAGENKLLLRIEGVNKVARFIAVEVRITDENEIPLGMFMPDMVDELPFFEEGNFIIEKELNFPFGVVAGTYYLSISLIHPQVQGFVDLDHSVKVELGGTTVNAGLKYSYTHGMGWLQIY
ncbi:MAG: ABC transporter ATP-binding protein [Paludibacteraceae bacterium]|nr:ABC transporter ATP-binding protein [Paludibacteraceae bacterium]